MSKITQDLVDQTFMVRNGTCGCYFDQEDVDRIREHIAHKFGVTLSSAEAIDFWRWRCAEWDGSWFGVDLSRDALLIEEHFEKFIKFVGVEQDDNSSEYSEPLRQTGVMVQVRDEEGELWELELDPMYHAELLRDIEAQIPEKTKGGTIRFSLEYDPTKIWGMRKLNG